MKISELLHTGNITFSCEIFPPKPGADISRMWEVVQGIAELSPDFISVTYGAGGSTSKRTEEIAVRIQEQHHIPALAHLTCVSSTREDIRRQLASFQEKGIENILALRGDIPQDSNFPVGAHYQHAYELIQDIKSQGDFCIGGACYPEGHVECESREEDIDHLKQKMECGCDFFTTQMFFDNNMLYNFLYRTLSKGIEVPIIAGIMPVTNARQVKRSCELSGSTLPARFLRMAERFSHDPASMKQAGIAYATEQIIDLIANGVNHIHLYTMNKPEIAAAIVHNLSDILR